MNWRTGPFRSLWRDIARIRDPGSLVRNASITFSGSVVTLAGQVLLTPVIARIYGPEAYGVYGLFISIVMNLSMVAGAGYASALVLPRSEERFLDLLRLCYLVLLGVVAISALAFAFFREALYGLLPGWAPLGDWALLIPVGVLTAGLVTLYGQWLVRRKQFTHTTAVMSGTETGVRVFNLIYGLVSRGAVHGLILGDVIVRLGGLVVLVLGLPGRQVWRSLRPAPARWVLAMARAYKGFALYHFPARWLALFSRQLPIFILPLTHDTAVVGNYAMANSLLFIPLRLFGYSISSVFLQKMTETHHRDPSDVPRVADLLFRRLLQVGVLPFMAIVVFGDKAFEFIFGSAWTQAGEFVAYLGVFFFFRCLSEPMVPVITVLRKENAFFRFQLTLFVASAATLLVAGRLGAGADVMVALFGGLHALAYAYLAGRILKFAGVRPIPHLIRTGVFLVGSLAAWSALRLLLFGDLFPGPL